jgi:hypothetical protein
MAQLVLYAMYYNSTQRQMEMRKRKEETAITEIVVMGDASHKVGMTV